jgi:hypothetical protein
MSSYVPANTVSVADHLMKEYSHNIVVQFTVTNQSGHVFLLDYCTYLCEGQDIADVAVSACQTLAFMGIVDASLTSEKVVWESDF